MDDYEDLVKRLRNRRICIQQSGSLDDFSMLAEAADAIEELMRGAWRGIGKTGRIFVCSACDKTFPYKTNFCPNCGAKMEES